MKMLRAPELYETDPNWLSAYASSDLILLVDDDPEHLLLFSTVLENAGYEVLTASNARDGLRLLKTEPISCVISDIMMPETSGVDFVKEARSSSKLRLIPIILLTSGREDLEFASLALGADMFCLKKDARRLLPAQVDFLLG